MTQHKLDSILLGKIEDLKKEIAADDYQVIKAMRDGVDVSKLYPEHKATYKNRMDRLRELEEKAAALASEITPDEEPAGE
jgi:hypothetical protein